MSIEGENFGAAGNVDINQQNNYFGGKSYSMPNTIPTIPDFVGREDYKNDLQTLYDNGKKCFVLHGTGGVGKTALALAFANQIEGDFEAKVFIDMLGMSKNPLGARDAMLEAIRQFGHDVAADAPDSQVQTVFTQVLKQQKTLVVLDNARDKDSVAALDRAGATLLITSRAGFVLPGGTGKKIEQLTVEDARNLLFEIAGEDRFEGHADELAHMTGYLPMAIKPLASMLAEDSYETVANLITKYSNKQKLFELHVPGYNLTLDETLTVGASFELSYESLSEEMRQHWKLLSVFPSDFDEKAIAGVLGVSSEEARLIREHLIKLSLLEGNPETMRFHLHDLARSYTDSKITDAERFDIRLAFAKYYASVLMAVQQMQNERVDNYYMAALNEIDLEWTNVLSGQALTATFLGESSDAAEIYTDYVGYARDFLLLRLPQRENIRWLENGIIASKKLGDRSREGKNLGNLGNSYHSLGEYRKAIEFHEQSLDISREIGDRSAEGNTLGNLGIAYKNLGEYRKAVEFHEQSLEIKREIGDRDGEGNTLGNLGVAYRNLGEYRKAVEFHEQSLEIKREIGDRAGEGTSLGNLGIAYHTLGEYRKAVEFHEQSLEIAREIGNRSGEGKGLGNLGNTYYSLEEYGKAVEFHEQSLEIKREIGDRFGEGNSLGNLGIAYQSLGEVERACALWKESVDIFEAIESPNANVVSSWLKKAGCK